MKHLMSYRLPKNSAAIEEFTLCFTTEDESITFVFITYRSGNISFFKLHSDEEMKDKDETIFVEKVKEFPHYG